MTNQTNLLPASLIPLIPFIDGDAFIGAFCGAILYVVSSPESSMFKRLVYMIVSFMTGYSFAPVLASKFDIAHHGIPAFIVSAFLIVIFFTVIDKMKAIDLMEIIRSRR